MQFLCFQVVVSGILVLVYKIRCQQVVGMIDHTLARRIVVAAGISGAMGVILGSFGAHGLDSFLAARGLESELILKRLDQFDTAVRYHLLHSAVLLALAAIPLGSPTWRRWVYRLFLCGLVLFSGSLYLLVLTNTPVLGAITPLGGVCWIVAWLMLPFLSIRSNEAASSAKNSAD